MAEVSSSPLDAFPATATLLRVLARSFALQASWNFERLQNLGFLCALLPGLRKLYSGDDLAAACRRHLDYFNTHPFMAPAILGATLHLEADVARGQAPSESVGEFKQMVMAPYAAMGDAFFWGGLRPLAALIALFFAFKGSLWGVAAFLGVFNLPHLFSRIKGLWSGSMRGLGIIQLVQARRLPDLAMKAKEASVILMGGLAALLVSDLLSDRHLAFFWGGLLVPLVLVLVWLARRGVSPLPMVYTGIVLLMLFAGLMP